MFFVDFYRSFKITKSEIEMHSFNSWVFVEGGQGKPIWSSGTHYGFHQCFPWRWLCREQKRSWQRRSHTCKKTNSTYHWITRGKLLNANHDFLGEGPGPEHLWDQAFAACLLRRQLPATKQHFICLNRRVETAMKCAGQAGTLDPNPKFTP